MSDIASRINDVRSHLPQGVNLVAVSKFHPAEAVLAAYNAGQRVFGESRASEFVTKAAMLPADIEWHFIGHLQTNKVKSIVGKAALIESVDSRRLLELIDSVSLAQNIVTDVLMQVHVAAEETKYGWSPDELLAYFADKEYSKLQATHLRGLMAMATNTDDTDRIEKDFATVGTLHKQILDMAPELKGFDIISMGMSDDYELAIRHGSTSVRIGSYIFGERKL